MSRTPKAELPESEVIARIQSKRRTDAIPVVTVPEHLGPSGPALFIKALFLLIRREQIWRVREAMRLRKRPEMVARANAYNSLPEVEIKRKEAFKKRYHSDPEYRSRLIASGIEYFKQNREKQYARIRARKPITQERDRAYIREWQRKKRAEDPQYRIGNRLRSRLWHALHGAKKAAKTVELVGCSIEEARRHLESLFLPGMDWSNVHIDHIRPCASFDLRDPEEQRQCFNFKNLQPLSSLDNLSKGDKWLGDSTRLAEVSAA